MSWELNFITTMYLSIYLTTRMYLIIYLKMYFKRIKMNEHCHDVYDDCTVMQHFHLIDRVCWLLSSLIRKY